MFFHRHLDQIIYTHYLLNYPQPEIFIKIEIMLNQQYYYDDQFLNQLNLIYSWINYWLKTTKDSLLTLNQINLITIVLNHIPVFNYPKTANNQEYFNWLIDGLIKELFNLDFFIIVLNYFLIKNNIASLFSLDNLEQIENFKNVVKTKNFTKMQQTIEQHCFDYKGIKNDE